MLYCALSESLTQLGTRLPREIDCFEPRPGVLKQGRQNQWKLCPFFGARPSRCLFSHEKTLLGPKRRTARPRNNNYCITEGARKTPRKNFSRFNFASCDADMGVNTAVR